MRSGRPTKRQLSGNSGELLPTARSTIRSTTTSMRRTCLRSGGATAGQPLQNLQQFRRRVLDRSNAGRNTPTPTLPCGVPPLPRFHAASRRTRFTLHEARFTFFSLFPCRFSPVPLIMASGSCPGSACDGSPRAEGGWLGCEEAEVSTVDAEIRDQACKAMGR
jgi:hypothetical protein